MLVIRRALERSNDDRGSTLVVVLIIMLVLSIAGMALAAIVTSTTSSLAGSRDTAQSRAAADAGMAAGVSEARRTGDFCALSLTSSTAPKYTLTSSCTGTQVTFVSTGHGVGGGKTVSEAVYTYTETPTMSGAAELVFFNSGSDSVYFTNHVMPLSTGLATVLFPGGGLFECKTTVPANLFTTGSVQGQAGCTINGSLYAGGDNPYVNKKVSYAVFLNNSDSVVGSVFSNGNTHMGGSGSTIGGNLTMPTAGRLYINGTNQGAITSSPKVKSGALNGIVYDPALGKPVLDPWFEYPASNPTAEWPGYNIVTLTATSTPVNCTNWKGSATTFWSSYVTGLTQNTVIDGRACKGGMDTAQGANATASIGVNVVFIANAFTLGNLKISAKAGKTPSTWFVVPDKTNDGKPTCPATDSTNQWDWKIENDADMIVTVNSMMYTPCVVRIGSGGTWTGAMYSGSLDDGGTINIYTSPMALPGQWGTGPGGSGGGGAGSSTKSLGSLVSQRDVP